MASGSGLICTGAGHQMRGGTIQVHGDEAVAAAGNRGGRATLVVRMFGTPRAGLPTMTALSRPPRSRQHPVCFECGVRMTLKAIEPNPEPRYRALDVHSFECPRCGGSQHVKVVRFVVIEGDAA